MCTFDVLLLIIGGLYTILGLLTDGAIGVIVFLLPLQPENQKQYKNMNIEEIESDKTICANPLLDAVDIFTVNSFLTELLDMMDKYPDKSLFFQNPHIIEGWIILNRAIEKINKWEIPENDDQREEFAEFHVAYLYQIKTFCDRFEDFYHVYRDRLLQLVDLYGKCPEYDFISMNCKEALCEDKYENDLKDIKDFDNISQYVAKLNKESHDARFATFSIISNTYKLLTGLMNRSRKLIVALYPTEEDFANAFDNDLRIRTRSLKEKMLTEMEEELARHYMENRTDECRPELWGKMMGTDETALTMAKNKQLSKSHDLKLEHWGKATKRKMEKYGRLMKQILVSIRTKELFDPKKKENVKRFVPLLRPNNLSLFYDLIIRRSLIQCEMFPKLKAQHEAWLNKTTEHSEEEMGEQTGNDYVDEILQELLMKEAQPYWQRLRNEGFIDTDGYDLTEGISNNQATYIAYRFSEKLGIKHKWKPFVRLWGIPNMAQLAGNWQKTGDYPPRAKEIDDIFGVMRDKPKGYVRFR